MGDKQKQQEKEKNKFSKKDLKLIGKIGKKAFYELKKKQKEDADQARNKRANEILEELGYHKPKQEIIPEVAEAPASEKPEIVQLDKPVEIQTETPASEPVILPQRDSSLPREPLVQTVDKPEASEAVIAAESIKVEAPIIVPVTVTEKTETEQKGKGEKRKMTEEEKFKGFSLPLEELVKRNQGNGTVNAAHASIETGISMSTQYELKIRGCGRIIPVVILPATIGRRPKMIQLPEKDVGKWTRDNVQDWEKGIFYGKIGHCNIISTEELDMTQPIVGLALVSAKEVTQVKGRQVFHHIIIIPEERIEPAFELSINNVSERDDDEIVVGPTIGALYDDKEVKEYLHLKKI